MSDFSVSFDPGSLAKITELQGIGALLNPAILQALIDAGNLIVDTAQANTWEVFDNPTGALASSIYFWVAGPEEVDVAVGVPYGRRQELGGGGGLDSLGRRMTNPAKPYLAPAVEMDRDQIRMIAGEAVLGTFGGLL